ncbi:DUF1697 domain-containing protein [Neobacillus sp. PS3-34]|uniref:DUF1697 domain-containing protein n=1 Tax=Neobacillus sp. PS3-34 TaxID=3070678 RepID=UPI0027E10A41|nr:DUF1697 domain-containing protein [Neobacillus sp. PS3-34]WML48583.1 DUF1697 domain-containing protein [Neobacillus sp. PS3-34]
MTNYIALLRGINVGGHNIIKMQELRTVLTNMGLEQVRTYIQSGNVLFQSDKNASRLSELIEQEINNAFGFSVTVILRTEKEWEQLIKNCPYPVDSLLEGESVHVACLAEQPKQEAIDHLLQFKSDLDECYIEGKEIYFYFRQSIRDSKLASQLPKIGVPATVRNWKTILKLEAMLKQVIEG